MSETTLVNFRLDQETKRSMEGVCHDLGMSMTTAFTLFAKKVDRERRIPFDVSLDGAPAPLAAQPVTIAANHADPAVIVEDVVRVFGEGATERRALDGASLTVRRGEFVAIMGPSGSGKSTLLHILGGVDSATSGRVVVDGMDLSTLGTDALALYRRHTVGLVYQFHNLVPFLSARDNIELPVRFDGSRPDSATIAGLLELLDIAGCEKSMPSELSGGQQQRVAIARALVSRPAVVLADEPTGSLDRANGERVVELLRRARERLGTTIVLVTHDEGVAAAADRVVRISDGRVVCGEE
uniref:type II toxin-antitoxin system RelB/DinJ family antitoxin n=1 Tax=Olsenella timonensis TaxID=1805478 RepID=UPI0009FAB4FF|nr:type II toxin-antitoxin system RelB/DinJ family antitoxin [Olsenella timonensis]